MWKPRLEGVLRHYFTYCPFHTKHPSPWRFWILQNRGGGVFHEWGEKFPFFIRFVISWCNRQNFGPKTEGGGCFSHCNRNLRFWPKTGGVWCERDGTCFKREIVLLLSHHIKKCLFIFLQNKFFSSFFQKNFCFWIWNNVFSFCARRTSVWPKFHYWSYLGWFPN